MAAGSNGGTLTINDWDNVTLVSHNPENGTTQQYAGLESWNGTVTISNVNNLTLGTKDDPLRFNPPQVNKGIHAASGNIDIKVNNDFNLYVSSNDVANTIAVQQLNGGTGAGEFKLNAGGDVNVGGGGISVFLAGNNKNGADQNKASLSITGKNVSIAYDKEGKDALAVYNSWDKGYSGTVSADINGTDSVTITGGRFGASLSEITDDAKTVQMNGTLNVSSNGAVNISGKNSAVRVSGADGTNMLTKTAAITGKTVNLVSDGTVYTQASTSLEFGVVDVKRGSLDVSGDVINVISNKQGKANQAFNVGTNGSVTVKGQDGNSADIYLNSTSTISGTGASLTFGDKTVTHVNVEDLKDKPLVSVTNGGKFTAEEGAKLQVRGAYTGKSLYSTDDNTNSEVTFWSKTNTSFDNAFQYLDENGVVRAGVTESNAASLAGFIALSVGIAATTANDSGITTLAKNGASSYNEGVGIGQAGGVQHGTYAVTGLVADALTNHEDTAEKDVWAKGFHSTEDIDGLGFEGGALDLDTQYNGAVAGIDLYQKDDTSAGVAFSYADGNVSGESGGVYTKNDAEYLGISLYGKKDFGAYRLAADLSYLGGSHDLTQYNNGTTVTAKPDTEAWTLGVKALKDYDLGSGTLTPYAGVRYLRLTTDSYTSSLGLSYDSENQNLFLLPVGADYTLNLKRGDWTVAPYVGLGYIWTVGDRSADQTVSYGTTAGSFAYDVTDAGSFLAKAGISAAKGDYAFSLGYAYQKGSTVDSDTWTAAASYRF